MAMFKRFRTNFMKKIILLLAIFLAGCAADSYQPKPIFSDSEKASRRDAFDNWFRNPSAH
jgi:PBP1b-binding outer membrane lipoprotein LpoB